MDLDEPNRDAALSVPPNGTLMGTDPDPPRGHALLRRMGTSPNVQA